MSTWYEVCKLGRAFPNLESLVLAECPLQSLMTPPPSPDCHLGILSYPKQGNGFCGEFVEKRKKKKLRTTILITVLTVYCSVYYCLRHDIGFATRRVSVSQIPQLEPNLDQNVGRCGHPGQIPLIEIPKDTGLPDIRSTLPSAISSCSLHMLVSDSNGF